MKRALLWALTTSALMAGGFAGAAGAQPGVYDALLLPTPGSTVTGAAALVDLPSDDTLTIGVQGLVPGAVYTFHVHETEAPGDPCLTPGATHAHEGWLNTTLVADAGGLGVGLATATSFNLHAHETYFVDVETPEGAVVACGMLLPRPV